MGFILAFIATGNKCTDYQFQNACSFVTKQKQRKELFC
jgi:hypothetical protein